MTAAGRGRSHILFILRVNKEKHVRCGYEASQDSQIQSYWSSLPEGTLKHAQKIKNQCNFMFLSDGSYFTSC